MAQRSFGELEGGDIAVVVLYFAGTIAVGCWSIRRSKSELSGYFLAGRSMTWWPIGMSMFASNIGSVNYMGIAGSAATSGYAVVMFEWNAVWLLMLLGWVFLPVYISSGIYTMPEYLQRRFGGSRLRVYLAVIALITYIFATISTDLFSGGLFIKQTFGLNIYIGVAILLAISVFFTVFGGLQTVIFTDAVAVVVMVLGGAVLSITGLIKIGGFSNLEYKYMRAVPNTTQVNSTCGRPPGNALHIFRSVDDPMYPWLGTVLRSSIGSLWYWCANQVLVQRALAAKDINHARGGTILAGYLKLLPMFLMIFPGMISRVLFPDEVACTDPEICERVCDTAAGCSNIALPKLVTELLPEGVRGLLVAAMIAAVISSLTSVFNSASALFTIDIWSKIRPQAKNRELLIVGKAFVVILTAVSVVWIPIMQDAQGGQIFVYATTVTGYLAAPTCAIFVLAVFWKRVNEPGAFYGMVIAQLWGLVRFVLDFIYPEPSCGHTDTRPSFLSDFHTYYHSFTQIVLGFVAAIVISLCTKAPHHNKIAGLTFSPPHHTSMAEIDEWKGQGQAEALSTEGEEELSDDSLSLSDRLRMLKQTPMMSRVVNANAVLLMTLTAFVYGWWH